MYSMKQTALITGASSGFGVEFARLFAKDGYDLILVARSTHKMEDLKKELQADGRSQVDIITMDLARAEAARELYNEVKRLNKTVDVLVNDAGVGQQGKLVETDLDKNIHIIQLNITSLVGLTQLFGTDMVARGQGKVLQVASVASFMPSANFSVYSATKAFVLSFSEAVQEEWKGTGVTMTILCPGASDTNFFVAADAENTHAAQGKLDDPKKVAHDGYDALMAGEERVISGFSNKVQATMMNVIPNSWIAKGARWMFSEVEEDDSKSSQDQKESKSSSQTRNKESA